MNAFAAAMNIALAAQAVTRPPAVPLVTHSPYFSVWSMADRLTDDWTKHWTGANHGMAGMIRIDGKTFRWMGPQPGLVSAMEQKSVRVLPTRSIYTFEAGGVELGVEFLSPLFLGELETLARPASYLTLTVKSLDGMPHRVSLYFDASAEWAVNSSDQKVNWSRGRLPGWTVQSFASQDQPVLGRSGDNLRIEWGRFFVCAPDEALDWMGHADQSRQLFADRGTLPEADDFRMPRPARDQWPVLAYMFPDVEAGEKSVSKTIVLAYDEELSIEYFRRKLPPFWSRKGKPASEMLVEATREAGATRKQAERFDVSFLARLLDAGGADFMGLASLAYRQAIAGHQIVEDLDGDLLMFSKENFSNGCIGTVDVTYPGSPLFLALAPELLEAQIRPILEYAASPRWPHPFAPHDLGTYPLANGQVYGGGERTEEDQMPVEECGNMLILMAALDHFGKTDLPETYGPILEKWAQYLRTHGADPGEQLCTDDFAGHLAHNVNLAAKAIVGVGAYGKMLAKRGNKKAGDEHLSWAKAAALNWLKRASVTNGLRLAFDRPGTWSQKYNLVWDRILGLGLFPKEEVEKEFASYASRLARFGLPLDNRADYTKLDWCVWTACLTGRRTDFEAHLAPLVRWINETPTRVPMTDWFSTKDGRQMGFQARTVVGGVFLPLLAPLK